MNHDRMIFNMVKKFDETLALHYLILKETHTTLNFKSEWS